jgi:hypothetical protein
MSCDVLLSGKHGRMLGEGWFLSAVLMFASVPAHAYVDPGTGSLAIQFVIGGAVAAAFIIKTYYYQLKRKIFKLIGRDTSDLPEPIQPENDGSAKPE